jgi:hypothetical protein
VLRSAARGLQCAGSRPGAAAGRGDLQLPNRQQRRARQEFSLLYREVGQRQTANLETRLAPLYDLVSTRYYPELTRDLAMKIGGEYSSDKVSKANFEQLAEDAGLAKPLVRGRVPELASRAPWA